MSNSNSIDRSKIPAEVEAYLKQQFGHFEFIAQGEDIESHMRSHGLAGDLASIVKTIAFSDKDKILNKVVDLTASKFEHLVKAHTETAEEKELANSIPSLLRRLADLAEQYINDPRASTCGDAYDPKTRSYRVNPQELVRKIEELQASPNPNWDELEDFINS